MSSKREAPPAALAVRVEGESSIGRSYGKKVKMEEGLGAARKALRDKTLIREWGPEGPEIHSNTLANVNLRRSTREQVLQYFHNTWDLTDTLFGAFKDDSVYYMIPDKLRRPLIFYFAHPAALYINKLHVAGLVDNINLYYQKLFETGVDEMSWDDMDELQDENYPWPTVAEAQAFRMQAKEVVEDLIRKMPEPATEEVTMESPYWALFLGFEHERIHIETSSVLVHQLPVNAVEMPSTWKYAPTNAPTPDKAPLNEIVDVAPGRVVLGKPRDFPSFGFDNEYGKRVVDVPSFKASKFLVSNAEFLPFVLAHGYSEKKWWVSPAGDDEGWRWVQFRNAKHPSWWVAPRALNDFIGGKLDYPYQKDDGTDAAGDGSQFRYRAEFDIIDMPWDWPVDVNYHEARAFLNWKASQDGKKYRVLTEAEFHLIRADPSPFPESSLFDPADKATPPHESKYDPIMLPEAPGNINLRYGSSTPVDMFPPSKAGFYDTHGNVWEWIEDHYAPLPGFEIHWMYDDFSTPCFDGWHTMMIGGCWVSTGDQASNFARYAFRRHFFQHLGFRYVCMDECTSEPYPGAATATNLWEGIGDLSTDVTNAFGTSAERLAVSRDVVNLDLALDYNQQLAKRVLSAFNVARPGASAAEAKVLHLGCGVGGLTFALTSHFEKVYGVDNSEVCIRHARIFQHHSQLEYKRLREGVVTETAFVKLPASIDRTKVTFLIDDAAKLSDAVTSVGPFDAIVVDGLLTRVVQPLDLLSGLATLLNPRGLLLISSDNDWDPSHTPRNGWLGGFKMNGEDISTLHMLRHTLKKKFDFIDTQDIAKLRRRHARRFDLFVMETSAWVLRGDLVPTVADTAGPAAGAAAGAGGPEPASAAAE